MSTKSDLLRIVKAADALEGWLSKNSGTNDDWPVRINADQESADTLCRLLTVLTFALEPYRREMKTD